MSINRDFNDLDILRRVITEAGGDYLVAGYTKAALERTFTEVLKGHKTLLIMDDVWDTHAWENVLKTPLTNALVLNGSRVLITTRDNRAARSMMAEEPYHRIRKLGREDAWLLLKKQVSCFLLSYLGRIVHNFSFAPWLIVGALALLLMHCYFSCSNHRVLQLTFKTFTDILPCISNTSR